MRKENKEVKFEEEKVEEEAHQEEEEEEEEEDVLDFRQMGLDERILYAIETLSWFEPTPIQETAIPLILEGKDVLAKARTGSGKTGAYAIPLIHKILTIKKSQNKQSTYALVLTPSRELCTQATRNLNELSQYCQRELTVVDISTDLPIQTQKQLLSTKPDIIVTTPMKILTHLTVNIIFKRFVQFLKVKFWIF